MHAARHAARACGAKLEDADLHPLRWHVALLGTALRALRSPSLDSSRKKAAWHLCLRCASALGRDLRVPSERTSAAARRCLEDGLVLETRLSLACVQVMTTDDH